MTAATDADVRSSDGPQEGTRNSDSGNAVFVFEVDGTTYEHNRPKITGGEIMDIAGIPRAQGLVQVNQDGTTTSIAADQKVHLVPEARFKRRPRFKRG